MVKYRLDYYSEEEQRWRLDISTAAYTGDPIIVDGVENKACVFTYTNKDDPYAVIIPCSVSISLYSDGQIDVEELQNANDRDFTVQVYREGVLYWTGFVVPDRIQKELQAPPFEVSFTAIDGLNLLDGIDFTGINNWPIGEDVSNLSPLAYIRDILFREVYLGLKLPITWISSIVCTAYPDDVYGALAGTPQWGDRGRAFKSYIEDGSTDVVYRSCSYVLESLLKAFQCRIFQSNGKWNIRRINDVVTGSFTVHEVNTDYGPSTMPIISTSSQNVNKSIQPGGNYQFIREDQSSLMIPGLKSVVVTYRQKQQNNLVPNGSFETSSGNIFEWVLRPTGSGASLTTGDSLNNRIGVSADVSFPANSAGDVQEVYLTMFDSGKYGMPIDTKLLFKTFRFGFTFCPLNGFPYYTETGIINWDTNPLRVSVRIKVDGKELVLNENGYWMPIPQGATFNRYNYSGYSDPNDNNFMLIDSYFSGSPINDDYINFSSNSTVVMTVPCPMTQANNLEGYLNFAGQRFVEGTDIESYEVIPDGTTGLILRCRRPNQGVNVGMGWGLSPHLRDGTIPVSVNNMKIGDVATVNFGGGFDMKFPEPEVLTAGECEIEVRLYVKRGQRILFDDVFMSVEENNDVYRSENPSSSNTKTESVDLEVSSSFSGFMVSNIMTSWTNSSEEYVFTDGKYTGSLTGMTANAMMRFRYKPSVIFEGTVYGKNWSYDEIYSIESFGDRKFLPLQSTYNSENCELKLVASECRDDNPTLSESHYASSDRRAS
ncbi:hypothetical protein RYH73_03405 [Olivibacter sp. CPCC 100613]|uniref:hypothetical protein n=1 Tax=Olivibacter sp. CPCC 100613 TaxID=3079931 RepID=UPI002FF7C74B